METQKEMIYEDENFEFSKIEHMGIIKIKKNVFKIITDLANSHIFMDSWNILENDKLISGIIIFNEKDSLGNEEYKDYLARVSSHKKLDDRWDTLKFQILNNETRTREHVVLNNIISKIVRSNKIIVNASNGEIVTPFFGAALAADLRFASADTVYLLSHAQMDVHPNGAVPYFLPKYLGHAKAAKILLCSDKITAQEAFELGIVFEIFPSLNYEELCVEKVRQILNKGDNVIKSTIKMLAYNFIDLEKYTNMEVCEFAGK
ncbi:MAG: enoyl-CoA hydratase/isomerase family protein [Bacteroidetes bacterium]|nr:enoyl-CoA hydratase/isomerase family protein [Bacteroidota bacterium]